MRVQESIRISLLILTSTVLMLGNGCRSMNNGESFWKRPNLSSFAFGKKKDDSVPKPPALHFDPTPANSETELAAKKSATKNTAADLENSLNKLAKAETKPTGKASGQASDTQAQPLRSPYQVSSNPGDEKTRDPNGKPSTSQVAGLASKTGPSDFKLPETLKPNAINRIPAVAPTADQARAQFKSDMQNLNSTAKSNAGLASSNIGNNLAGLSAKADDKIAGLSAQTASGAAAIEKKMSAEQRRLEAEVAKAKQEIADLKTQLMANNQMLAPIGSAQAGTPAGISLGGQSVATQSTGAQSSGTQSRIASGQDFQPRLSKTNPVLSNAGIVGNEMAPRNVSQNGFEPLRPNSNVKLPAPTVPPAAASYPSTTHGGFTAAVNSVPTKPDPNVQRVELQAPLNAKGDAQQDFGSASADIDIPDSVLRGTGSFSPGSVNRLRGN